MAERPIGVTDEAAGAGVAEFRTRERSVGGNTVCEQYLLLQEERVRSYAGLFSTFRIPGVTGSGQNFASIFNAAGSAVTVAVKSLSAELDYFTNSATVRVFNLSRLTSAPSGGSSHTPVPLDTAQTASGSVAFRGGATADGTASAITATAGTMAWRQYHQHNVSAVEQMRDLEMTMLPLLSDVEPAILAAGEGLLVQLQDASSTSTGTIINCMFEEFTLP